MIAFHSDSNFRTPEVVRIFRGWLDSITLKRGKNLIKSGCHSDMYIAKRKLTLHTAGAPEI